MIGNEISFLRDVIGNYMKSLGERNDRVIVVNADLAGTCRNRSFAEAFPQRSFNVGIAEQNMVSFSAGLASEGFIPYAFSMAPFLTMRACEQCRTDVAYGNRNVRLMGVYAGVSGGISGATHWGIEDCGIMTAMPGVAVMEVSDAYLAKKVLDLSLKYKGPMYIRISVEPVRDLPDPGTEIKVGGSRTIEEGTAGAILCSGVTVQYAWEASKQVREKTGKRIRVVDMYSIKPIDRQAVVAAARTGNVMIAQDHNVIGGLGSAVAQIVAEEGIKTNLKILGIPDTFDAMAHAQFLYKKYGLNAESMAQIMTELLGENG